MSHYSKARQIEYSAPLDKKQFERLIRKINALYTVEKADAFLKKVFTPKETSIILKRLIIIDMLEEGLSQRTISQVMRVSTKTITRISKLLQDYREKLFKY